MEKTHAMRMLDARGISYETVTYDASGAFHSAEEAAALLGVPPAAVFKTLVVLREAPRSRPMLVMVASNTQIDLKVLAQSIGEKKLRMSTLAEAEQLTRMQAGGISALGLLRPALFDVLIEESARMQRIIHVSAGMRGVDLALHVTDLVAAANAKFLRAV